METEIEEMGFDETEIQEMVFDETDIEEMGFDEDNCPTEDVEYMSTETNGEDCREHSRLIINLGVPLERVEQPKLESKCCIYKVPRKIRETNPEAYTPKVVSIGPIHHRDKKLKPMEELKLRYLKSYLLRTGRNLVDCIKNLREKEDVRSCYAEIILPGSDNFVKMILIDACFIVEYFIKFVELDRSDPIISNPVRRKEMRLDLLLLENQLPFFVFEDLFTPTRINRVQYSSFLEVSFVYFWVSFYDQISTPHESKNAEFNFDYFREKHLKKRGSTGTYEEVKVQHLTDILRFFFLPSHELLSVSGEERLPSLKYSASQLHEAGLKFTVGETSLIVLQLKECVLRMPQLLVEYDTEAFLRNMAALEQCHYPYETYITEYVVFLDFLINDRKDVDILVDNGVMVNRLGDSNKVVAIFNDICMGMEFSNCTENYL